ncbi:MAG: hypothetical protein VKJ04_06580 [Vampirovibrionales bacterium]|nr:hypothetical protein [Vampirovibrionales bacterium]
MSIGTPLPSGVIQVAPGSSRGGNGIATTPAQAPPASTLTATPSLAQPALGTGALTAAPAAASVGTGTATTAATGDLGQLESLITTLIGLLQQCLSGLGLGAGSQAAGTPAAGAALADAASGGDGGCDKGNESAGAQAPAAVATPAPIAPAPVAATPIAAPIAAPVAAPAPAVAPVTQGPLSTAEQLQAEIQNFNAQAPTGGPQGLANFLTQRFAGQTSFSVQPDGNLFYILNGTSLVVSPTGATPPVQVA